MVGDMVAGLGFAEVGLAVGLLLATLLLVVLVSKRSAVKEEDERPPVLVVYASTRGRSRELASKLVAALEGAKRQAILVDASCVDKEQLISDPWDELLNGESREVAILVSTAHGGRCPEPARPVIEDGLEELVNDFRVGRGALKGRRFAVLGLGSRAYDDAVYCTAAKKCEHRLRKLGAARVATGTLDDTAHDGGDAEYALWEKRVVSAFVHETRFKVMPNHKEKSLDPVVAPLSSSNLKVLSKDEIDEEDEAGYGSDPSVVEGGDDDDDEEGGSGMVDLEDIGAAMKTAERANQKAAGDSSPKAMVTAAQAKSLKKEGYKLIGTHSAVKLCRWTKHQLRGRGGCYKHTFYGITSYQCMEATPSLACANKCTFCWRHHKNPVGREWKWKTDGPDEIVSEAVRLHVGMINECKGIPGVLPDRWKEAHTVRHCALSLVGEPIMYPRINELIGELHSRSISTFLVTNAQFPDAIKDLVPVTQLYVSVDAPNRDSLEEVDRPLFSDAWERLRESLRILKNKQQRTVARLTVVKGHNSDDLDGYAELMQLGLPTMIEIKGVTFCGTSDASDLTMDNCPWHHEVVAFAEELIECVNKRTNNDPKYAISCSHKHSVCVLVCRIDELGVTDEKNELVGWNTWIDYDKFHQLNRDYHASNGEKTFSVRDYRVPTAPWALHGAEEEGFDPSDLRQYKKKANGKSR